MQANTPQPHDHFFKVAFSRLDVVIDYLKQFLSPKIAQRLDYATLKITNQSFITAELEQYFADVVWECIYGDGLNTIKIAFIFEHKSFIPQYPHLQILRYMLEGWQSCEDNDQPLTPLIPIIVYHNKDNRHWQYKPFSTYFKGIDEALLPYIPQFEYQLTDLTTMTPEQIMALEMGLLTNALLTLLLGQRKNVVENAHILMLNVKNIAQDEHFITFFYAQLAYILKNNEFSSQEAKKYISQFNNTTNMNAYDMLQQEGKEIGKEIGRELLFMELIAKRIAKGFSVNHIAEDLDITVNHVITIINKYKL